MRVVYWIILGLGIAISISSVALRIDAPATPFDESETSFDLGAPVTFSIVARPAIVREGCRITILVRQRVRRSEVSTTDVSQFPCKLLSKTLIC